MNPYAESNTSNLASMNTLFDGYAIKLPKTTKERKDELITYFSEQIRKPKGYIRFLLTGMMDLDTLHYIKSACDQYAARPYTEGGGPWSKAFYGMLKSK